MKKHILKRMNVILLIMSLILTFVCTTAAYAEENEKEFMTLSKQTNIIINIKYDKEVPTVSFIAPDGTIYKEGQTPTDIMLVEHGDNRIYYTIPNAQAGTWKIRYDKLSNETMEIDAVEYVDSITVDSFVLDNTDTKKSMTDVKFLVNYKDRINYNYEISAVLLDENNQETESVLLSSGTAMSNEEKKLTVSLSKLATHDDYKLKLYVYANINDRETFNYAYSSDSISYVNENTPKAQGNIDIELNKTEGILYLDWHKEFGGRKCNLTVYDSSSETEPIYTNEFDRQDQTTQISTDINASYVRVELRYEQNGLYSDPVIKEIKLNDDSSFNINIVTEEMTNSYQAKVEYKNAESQKIDLCINEETTDMELSGDGDFSVNLDEYYNTLEISYNFDEFTKIIISKDIYSDRVAPILRLYENKGEINVNSSSYIITGETEPDCTMLITNKAVPIANDGTFSYEVKLNNGKNSFEIIVTDKAGNKTVHSLDINRKNASAGNTSGNIFSNLGKQFSSINNYWLLLVSFILSALFAVCIMFVKVKKISFKPVSIILSTIGIITTAYMYIKKISISLTVNSSKYFDIAKESIEKANKLLNDLEFYKTASRCSLIVTAVIVLITIIYLLATKKKKIEEKQEG